jgi:gliding motility-associated-like protein
MRLLLTTILSFFSIALFAQINTSEEIVINYVSINTIDQQVNISWNPYSDTSEIDGYIIYEYANLHGSWGLDTLTAVYVGKVEQWTFPFDKVRSQPVQFAVVAYVGTVGNVTARSTYKIPHQTIYNTLAYDSCAAEIDLKWNKYGGWGNMVSGYKIFNRITGEQVGIVSASDTTFKISNVQTNQVYSYYVIATHNNGIYNSLSNVDSIFTKTMIAPAFIEAQNVNVIQNITVEISFSIDPNTELHNYQLLRSTEPNGNYTLVRDYTNYMSNTLTISDSPPTQSTIYYKLQSMNNCNHEATISNIATGIVPSYTLSGQQVSISWTDYLSWPQGILVYYVYRTIGNESPVRISTLNGNSRQYTDDISSLSGQQLPGNICYTIESVSNPNGSGATYKASSYSVCIDVASQVFVPEAFTPNGDGLNDEFRPYFAFLPSSYMMLIYNRYGFKVFETKEITKGWNGMVSNNTKAPEGAYIYFITFETTAGNKIEKKGNFALIYP